METVFSHNITPEENAALFFVKKTEEQYLLGLSDEKRLWHLARLFEGRGDSKKAMSYWEQIPELLQEYKLGKDELILTA